MNYKKLLLQLGMFGTTITPISTIIACGTESTKEIDEAKKAIVKAKVEFDKNSFNKKTIITGKLPSELQSESANTPLTLGFTEPKNIFDTKITYKVKSTNDVEGTLVVETTIKKGEETTVIEFILIGFQTTTQKVVDDIKIELNGKTYQTNLESRTITFPSEIGNVGDITTSNEIGYEAPATDGITFKYVIKSIDYETGTLTIIVKISKLETISKEAIITLEGFQTTTKEVNDAQQKINAKINKATLPKIVNDANFLVSRNLVKNDFDIQQPRDDSITLEIQSVTTSDDKTTTITIEVSSSVKGTTPKTYLVTSFIVKLKNPTQISKDEFKDKILPKGSTLPNSVKKIYDWAFWDTKFFLGFTLPNSITNIGRGAFYKAELPQGFTIPNSVTSIGSYAFSFTTLPKGFTIPNSVTSIGEFAFRNSKLPKEFTISNSVTSIHNYAFSKTILPQGFTLPNSVTSIGENAFDNAQLSKGFTIPNNIKYLASNAFNNAKLPRGCVWLDKDGKQINTPIVGARVGQVPT